MGPDVEASKLAPLQFNVELKQNDSLNIQIVYMIHLLYYISYFSLTVPD